MKGFLKILILPAAFLIFSGSVDQKPRLTFDGLGAIKIGMTAPQAKNLGFKVSASGPWGEEDSADFIACHYLESAPDFPGVFLMMSEGRVVRIDIDSRGDIGWQSYSGAKIGMSESDVKAIYGNWLKVSGHPYLGDAGSYLQLNSSNGKYAMIFETAAKDMSAEALENPGQEKYVTDFRAGLTDSVGYIEGCA